jgi:hypothetical protein
MRVESAKLRVPKGGCGWHSQIIPIKIVGDPVVEYQRASLTDPRRADERRAVGHEFDSLDNGDRV